MSDPGKDIDVYVGPHPEGSAAPGGTTKRSAVIIDRRSQRAWSGEGWTDSEATTEAVRRFLGDRRAREYVG